MAFSISRTVVVAGGGLAAVVLAAALGGCADPAAQAQQQGIGYYHEHHYHMAVAALDKAAQADPLNPKVQYYTGLCYLRMHRYEQAEYHLKTAWLAYPGQKGLKHAMVQCMVRQGKTDELLNFLERDAALTARTQNPRTLPQAPRWQPRPPAYHRIRQLYASRIKDRLRVAKLYEKIGDMDNAQINYNIAARMATRHPGALMECARFYQRIGNKRALASILRRVYHLNPSQPGLVSMMTRNGIYISNITPPPKPPPPPASH